MSETFVDAPFGELVQLKNDKSKQLKSNEYKKSGKLPIVDQGSTLVCGFTWMGLGADRYCYQVFTEIYWPGPNFQIRFHGVLIK